MKVLMTGHHGYIGTVMAPFFRAAGHDVVGLDNYLFEGCSLAADRALLGLLLTRYAGIDCGARSRRW